MAKMIVNGKERQYEAGKMPATLDVLLKELDIEAAAIVAEIDGEIIKRDKFGQANLADGQKIELIRFMGGG